jgi:hypothetical protein
MHVGARYYDAQVGRFLTRDTVLSEHPYLYCEHEPVSRVDPSGHIPAWIKDIINFNKPVTGPAWGWSIGIGAVGATAGNINYIMGPNPGPFGNGLGIISGLSGIGSGAGLIAGGIGLGGATAVGVVGIGAIAVGLGAVAVGYGIYRFGSNFGWW